MIPDEDEPETETEPEPSHIDCPDCGGSGGGDDHWRCPACKGLGTIRNPKAYDEY